MGDRSGSDCEKHALHVAHEYGFVNRKARRDTNYGLSPHGRVAVFEHDGETVRIPFQLTKKRPWTRRNENRKRSIIAQASRRKNRGK